MKKFVFALLLSFNTLVSAFANSPQSIGFQAIVRDAYGQLVAETPVGVHVIILRNNIEVVYEEERVVTSNSQGLLSFAIGDGNATTANSIENVDWSNGSFAIRCEMDLNGGTTYTVTQTTPLTSVPFAFYAQKVAPSALPEWVNSAEKPTYDYSEITGTPKIPTKLSELENDLFLTNAVTEKDEASTSNPILTLDSLESKEADPVFAASLAAGITAEDTARWNKEVVETDPVFAASLAASITAEDTARWNKEVVETDPVFTASLAAGITAEDTARWNKEVVESDPVFTASLAAGITAEDTARWNKEVVESDPVFAASLAAGITSEDTARWNKEVVESDPVFASSLAAGITAEDTARWNKEVVEADPVFAASLAAGITAEDTARWNKEVVESDPVFAASLAAGITAEDTARWNKEVVESDPVFAASLAAGITAEDTARWNKEVVESDPVFAASLAAGITAEDTARWNKEVVESDPVFAASLAAGITAEDTARWNKEVVETDPVFTASLAAGITAEDTARWNKEVVESDPVFAASVASKISDADTTRWNAKAEKADIPTKVSQLVNDSDYVSIHQLESILSSLTDRINKLENRNVSLLQKIDSLQSVVDSVAVNTPHPSVIEYKQVTSTYSFSRSDWNKAEDVYNKLRKGDRIIFVVRHSERPSSTGSEVSLTERGVTYARNAGAKMAGGLAAPNDAIYGSTEYLRCRQTSAYVAKGRGDSNWDEANVVMNPISVLNQYYITGTTDWSAVARYYDERRDDALYKCTNLVSTLCELSEGKTFAWFTSHDAVTAVLARWASDGKIKFQNGRDGWINFMSGIAVIVHANGSWEAYPVKNLDNGYMNW